MATGRVVVVGMGSEYRRDDGAGVAVADEVCRRAPASPGSARSPSRSTCSACGTAPTWSWWPTPSAPARRPGSVQVIELSGDADGDGGGSGGPPGTTSTHGIGLTGVLRLSRAVGCAPRRVVVVGIEGGDFAPGTGLSPAVADAVPHAVGHVVELVGPVA